MYRRIFQFEKFRFNFSRKTWKSAFRRSSFLAEKNWSKFAFIDHFSSKTLYWAIRFFKNWKLTKNVNFWQFFIQLATQMGISEKVSMKADFCQKWSILRVIFRGFWCLPYWPTLWFFRPQFQYLFGDKNRQKCPKMTNQGLSPTLDRFFATKNTKNPKKQARKKILEAS